MSHEDLKAVIEAAFENRDAVTPATTGEVREAVEEALDLLDSGRARVAEKIESSRAGARTISAGRVSAPCPTAWCAAPPTSRRAWCSCPPS